MVFQCECCQYSTPFKYTLKQHMATKRHLLKMKDAPDQKDVLRLKIEEHEKMIEDLLSQIEKLKIRRVNDSFNTTNHNVQNIHILLHPDMNLTQLTHYDYQVILKKIQDRDFQKLESIESLEGLGDFGKERDEDE